MQPPNGGRIDSVTPRDIGLRLAIGKALDGFSPLMGGELWGTAEFDTTGFRSLPACHLPCGWYGLALLPDGAHSFVGNSRINHGVCN